MLVSQELVHPLFCFVKGTHPQMEELTLQDHWNEWSNFVANREAARAEAQGGVGTALEDQLRAKNTEMAQLKADIYQLKARIAMAKGSYSKASFDAQWAEKKVEVKRNLEEAIAIELGKGKNPNQIAMELGTRNLNLIYGVKANLEQYRIEASEKVEGIKWCWSRFTGTQRYALDDCWGSAKHVLMKGAIETELEGLEAVWDFNTGVFLSGSIEVYNSDTESNRRKRADTLDAILTKSYTGTIKERPNPYFESVA